MKKFTFQRCLEAGFLVFFSWHSDLRWHETDVSPRKPVFMPAQVGMPTETIFKNPPQGAVLNPLPRPRHRAEGRRCVLPHVLHGRERGGRGHHPGEHHVLVQGALSGCAAKQYT